MQFKQFALTLFAGVTLLPRPVAAAPEWPQRLQSLQEAERTRRGAQLQIRLTEKESPLLAGETPEQARERMRTAGSANLSTGTLLTGDGGWRKEWSHTASETNPATRTIVSVVGSSQRTLFEVVDGEQPPRQVVCTPRSSASPGDPVLSGHLADYLVDWGSGTIAARGDAEEIRFDRGGESLVLTTIPGRPVEFARIRLERPLPGQPASRRQIYEATVTTAGGDISSIEEIIITPPPYSTVAYRETLVQGRERAPAGTDELKLDIPRGALVRDLRFGSLIEYEQGEQSPGDEQVRQLAERTSSEQVAIGDVVRDWACKDERGQAVTISNYRGKVVLVVWVASWSEASLQAARDVEKLFWNRYRSHGLQVVAIEVAEAGDAAAAARTVRSRTGISFPLWLDADAATFRQAGSGAGVPKVALIDRSGKLRYAQSGWHPDGVKELVEEVLDGDKPQPVPRSSLKGPSNPGRKK